jgi:hypothetical protein
MKLFLSLPAYAAIAAAIVAAENASARLGENELQSKARYGEPNQQLIGAEEKPLIPGAKETAYLFEGWRIRASFVNGIAHRIEYAKVVDGKPRQLAKDEVEAVLEAEKGNYRWREEKPRLGHEGLNKLKETFDGRVWERSDHAKARLIHLENVLQLESRDAERLAKQLAKTLPKDAKAPGKVPKF